MNNRSSNDPSIGSLRPFWATRFAVLCLAVALGPAGSAAAVPPTPTNPTPGSTSNPGPTLASNTVSFDWSSSSGATYYEFGVRDMNNNVLVVDEQPTSSHYTTTLTAGQPYRWNVAACNSTGCSSYTTRLYFQTPAEVPPTPTNTTPGSTTSPGPVLSSATVSFDWSSSSGATYYEFGVRDMSNNDLVVDTQPTSSHYTTTLTAGRPYRWNVAACNSAGCSAYTTRLYFQTPGDAPPKPTNTTPGTTNSPGPVMAGTTVSFDWSSSSGATYYEFGIRDMSNNVLVVDTQPTSSSTAATLEPGKPYRWNVAACNAWGCSSFTTPLYFQIPGEPDIRVSPLSLTFESPARLHGALFSSPDEKRSRGDQPTVVNTEVKVDFEKELRFSSHDIVAGSAGLWLKDGVDEGVLESSSVLAPISFASLGARWTVQPGASTPRIAVRSSVDGVEWSEWTEVTVDSHLNNRSPLLYFGNLISVPENTGLVQYRVRLIRNADGTSPVLTSLTFAFIDPGETPDQILNLLLAPEPPTLSRTQWDCPDGEDSPSWPPEPTTVSHLIVHHTVTTNSAVDWPAQVRSIWSDHTFSRNWGDIGYNYLIDPFGTIYEGRAGGENTEGASFCLPEQRHTGDRLAGYLYVYYSNDSGSAEP